MLQRTIKAAGLLLLLISFSPALPLCFAQENSQAAGDDSAPTAEALKAQIADIAGQADISFEKKEARIAAAVRLATATAVAHETTPSTQLELAANLATTAGADPRFTSVVVNAILAMPVIASIEGAGDKIRASAYTSAESKSAANPVSASVAVVEADGGSLPTGNTAYQSTNFASDVNASGNPFRDNTALILTFDARVTFDDNVYLSDTDTVSDQIFSLIPGIDLSFGQNSLLNGSATIQQEYLSYRQDSAPNNRLTHARGDLGYTDVRLTAEASVSFDESYQNSRETVSVGENALFETDTLSFDSKVRVAVSPLTGFKLGATYGWTTYDYDKLYDKTFYSIPFAVFYQATPKVDISLGALYREEESDDYKGAGVQDWYYNVGANGAFTAKLSGSVSAGYRTRHGQNNLDESMFGFTAGLNLELTAKSNLSLNADQDFNTSSQGQSTKNTTYTLGLSTSFTPQWSALTRISYQQIDYGARVYGTAEGSTVQTRKDDYWEGGVSVKYLHTSWLSAAASYTLRSNSSTLQAASFSNNLLTLTGTIRF